MTQYRVVPFVAQITAGQTSDVVAKQLADLINEYGSQGWSYVRLEEVTTIINHPAVAGNPGSAGCFGIGAIAPTPGYPATQQSGVYYMAVFSQG